MALDFIKHYSILENNIKIARKHIDIIEYYLYLTKNELSALKELLSKGEKTGMLVQEFIEEGVIKGKIEGKLEAAKKMQNKGFSVDDILDITGLQKEDLVEAKII